jgi:hypothetical protein
MSKKPDALTKPTEQKQKKTRTRKAKQRVKSRRVRIIPPRENPPLKSALKLSKTSADGDPTDGESAKGVIADQDVALSGYPK